MKVIVVKNYQEMSKKALGLVMAQLWEKPDSVLGLATGSTPLGLYKKLVQAYRLGNADFSKVVTFNLDEYYGLGPNDKQSYHYYMWANFFSQINIRPENIHIPDGLASNKEVKKYVRNYEKAIFEAGGIDLQILGLGRNGHLGFNEPGSNFSSPTRLVKLSASTLKANARFFSSIKQVPKQALTMGLGTIAKANKIILLAVGADKAVAVAATVEGRVSKKVPATILQKLNNVTFIIDEAAASKLKKNYKSSLSLVDKRFNVLTEDNLPKDKKIIVISPHPDDASISLGGTISALAKYNKVYTFIMTTGYRSFMNGKDKLERIKIREKEVRREGKILGAEPIFLHLSCYDAKDIKQAIKNDVNKVKHLFNQIKPDIIFLPHKKDGHPTHIASRKVTLLSLPKVRQPYGQELELWQFEGPWAIFSEGDFDTIFAFSKKAMFKKMQAIRAQTSQISRTRFDVAAESLARLRAALIPEQALFGFGQKKSKKLGDYFELFKVTRK
ncbi:glucosamine-6-phosphate deaminase [Patescibacteria group bacterium]|nr:glucosamine-6-phosphate deaminase [Patescibacteria group bacterium]